MGEFKLTDTLAPVDSGTIELGVPPVGSSRRLSVTYTPLIHDDLRFREFRLLKIRRDHQGMLSCDMRPYKFHQAPPYRALSYTWKSPFATGDTPRDETEDILVNNEIVTVGKNLASALKAVRDLHHRAEKFIWADAICIDQSNHKERAYQVTMMGDIFSRASSVFVWLGDEAQDSTMAMGFMTPLALCHRDSGNSKETLQELLRDSKYQAQWKALAALWNRRWWARAWVLQETVLAQNIDFCCGRSMVDEDDVFDANLAMRGIWDELYYFLEHNYDIHLSMSTHHALDGINRLRSARMAGNLYTMITCHFRTMSPRVTDPRDYVFAKLGMASDGYIVKPDYTQPVRDVYTHFVLNYIQETRSTDIIHFDTRPRPASNFPSWLPDWSADHAARIVRHDHRGDPRENLRLFSAAQDSTVPDEDGSFDFIPGYAVLELKGYRFDIIDGVARAEESSWGSSPETAVPMQPLSQPKSTKCAYTNDADIFEGLWRTMHIEPETTDGTTPDTGYLLADAFVAAEQRLSAGKEREASKGLLRFEGYHACIRDFNLFGKTVIERWTQAAGNTPQSSEAARTYAEFEVTNGLQFRRMVTTEGGYFGSGLIETQPGDVVAILLGGRVPVILREVEEGFYKLIGAAYLHGIMYGQGLDKLLKEGKEPEVFCVI